VIARGSKRVFDVGDSHSLCTEYIYIFEASHMILFVAIWFD